MRQAFLVASAIGIYALLGIFLYTVFIYFANRVERRISRYSVDEDDFAAALTVIFWPILLFVRVGILVASSAGALAYEHEDKRIARQRELQRENERLEEEVNRLLGDRSI